MTRPEFNKKRIEKITNSKRIKLIELGNELPGFLLKELSGIGFYSHKMAGHVVLFSQTDPDLGVITENQAKEICYRLSEMIRDNINKNQQKLFTKTPQNHEKRDQDIDEP